jgi:hypothetical protein
MDIKNWVFLTFLMALLKLSYGEITLPPTTKQMGNNTYAAVQDNPGEKINANLAADIPNPLRGLPEEKRKDFNLTNAPQIVFFGEDTLEIWENDLWVEPGFMAWDLEDGIITRKITVDASEVNKAKQGLYRVYYFVADKSENKVERVRYIQVVRDDMPPTIQLEGVAQELSMSEGLWVEPGYKARDNRDGNLTEWVRTEIINSRGQVIPKKNVLKPNGSPYTIKYTLGSDRAGNEARPVYRKVRVRAAGEIEPIRITRYNEEIRVMPGSYTLDFKFDSKDMYVSLWIHGNPARGFLNVDGKTQAFSDNYVPIDLPFTSGSMLLVVETPIKIEVKKYY